MATLVPCLVALRSEFNDLAPGRDKTSDGWIGDPAHAARKSDHNADSRGLVHAIDVDVNLRLTGVTMEDAVQHVLARCRSGAENRLRYVIYNRRIWEASNGWRQRAYTGDNPHDEHAHFSASYEPAREASTARWGLETLGGDMLIRKGDSGEEVRFWQHVLADIGYSPGEADGDYGPKTEAAINRYRADTVKAGPINYLSGWQAYHMLRTMMDRRAGKPGTNGRDGVNGKDGRDGVDGRDGALTGTLTVTGGQLTVEANPA